MKLSLPACSILTMAIVAGHPSVATEASPPNSAPPPPLEHFFAEPDIRSPQVSPDGRQLAFLTTLGTGKVGVALMDLATGKVEPLVAARDENIDIFFFKSDKHIIYSGDIGGNESAAYRSISLDRRKVVSLAESYRERVSDLANWATIVDRLPYDSERMLILGPRKVGSSSVDLWYLDVRTGTRKPVPISTDESDVLEYLADNASAVRARTRLRGEKSIVEVRADAKAPWATAAEFPANDPRWALQFFAADNETLYLLSYAETDTAALHSLNVRTLALSGPLYRPPSGEIQAVLTSYDRSKVVGVLYADEKPRYAWFDPERAQLQAQIDATLPHTFNAVVSRSADEQVLVILARSDREPGTYYLLDRRGPRLTPLGKVNRHVVPAQMRPMEPIQFTARDGLVIPGYLTRPAAAAHGPVPLIVNPHGGPFGVRDEWGFNSEAQFLASRGYAVLQVNYRGSGGYGDRFLKAGQREWGGKMQDDLTDGVAWAVAQGIADPTRVAIYGASYGGYAALAGATFTPDLYRAAVNYVGVSDLSLITSWARGRSGRGSDMFAREWVGDDRQYKFERSPVNFVDRIHIPTFHAYGFNDPRVEIEHWTRLEPKLKQFGKAYEAMVERDEGHGFDNEKARLRFYARLEDFLARHVLAPVPPGQVTLQPAQVVELPAKGRE